MIRKTFLIILLISPKLYCMEKSGLSNPTVGLHDACEKGELDNVASYIQFKAPLNVQDEKGRTPLQVASENGQTHVARLLIENGAYVDKKSIIFLLMAGVHVDTYYNIRNLHPMTLLHCAAKENWQETATFLVSRCNAEINKMDDMGMSALHWAAIMKHERVAEILLNRGAEIDFLDGENQTPLHKAVIYGNTDMAQLLLDHGACINMQDESGHIPLHFAVEKNYCDMIELLLKRGAGIDIPNDDGWSALSLAAHHNPSVARRMIEAHMPIDNYRINNLTLLQRAARDGEKNLVELLLEYNAQVNTQHDWTPLHMAALHGRYEIAKLLIKHGAKVDSQHKKEEITPLHFAVSKGYSDIIQLLVSEGADMLILEKNNYASLDYALFFNSPDILKILLLESFISFDRHDKAVKYNYIFPDWLKKSPLKSQKISALSLKKRNMDKYINFINGHIERHFQLLKVFAEEATDRIVNSASHSNGLILNTVLKPINDAQKFSDLPHDFQNRIRQNFIKRF